MGHANDSSPTTASLPRYLLSQNPKNKTGTWSSKAPATHIAHKDEGHEAPREKKGEYGTSNHDGGWGERQGRCGEAANDEGEGEGVPKWVMEWGEGGLCGGV